jgi:riboflavin synthase
VRVPDALDKYIVEKGSISIDGISLTVAAIADRVVRVAIIPHTRSHTNLASAKPGARVNLEVDILAKYLEKLSNGYTR